MNLAVKGDGMRRQVASRRIKMTSSAVGAAGQVLPVSRYNVHMTTTDMTAASAVNTLDIM